MSLKSKLLIGATVLLGVAAWGLIGTYDSQTRRGDLGAQYIASVLASKEASRASEAQGEIQNAVEGYQLAIVVLKYNPTPLFGRDEKIAELYKKIAKARADWEAYKKAINLPPSNPAYAYPGPAQVGEYAH